MSYASSGKCRAHAASIEHRKRALYTRGSVNVNMRELGDANSGTALRIHLGTYHRKATGLVHDAAALTCAL